MIKDNTLIKQLKKVKELTNQSFLPTNLQKPFDIIELDEMWSFIQNKQDKCWIWLSICRTTKVILGFATGCRGVKTGKLLWNKIKDFTTTRTIFGTDDWTPYKKFIPPNQHYIGKDETWTIEGYNGNFRDDLRRLTRKTKGYSKSQEMLDITLYLYIIKHNAKKIYWLKGIKGF